MSEIYSFFNTNSNIYIYIFFYVGVLKGCAKQVVGMSGKGTKSNESIEIRRQDEWDLCDEDDDDY